MTKMLAADAAARIRDSGLLRKDTGPSPEDRHLATYVERVCVELDIEPDSPHAAQIVDLMHELNIEPEFDHEYPKWVKTGRKVQVWDAKTDSWVDGPKDEMVVVENEDEEAHAGDLPELVAPVNPAPEPRTEVPTTGLVPKHPEEAQGFASAGQGRLVNEPKPADAEPTAALPRKPAPPAAPQRR